MRRFIPLAGLCLAVFLIMTGMGMAVAALPQRFLQGDGTLGASGWLAAAFALAYMACQQPAGRLADRLGCRPVLTGGCLLMALAAAIYSQARDVTALLAGRFIQGAGEAPIWAAAPALLARLYPAAAGRALGLYNAAFHLGLMLGPVLAARGLAGTGDGPFLAFCGLSLAAAGLVRLALPQAEAPGAATAAVLEQRPAARPGAAAGLWPDLLGVPVFGAAYGLLVSCLPVHLALEWSGAQERMGRFFLCAYAGIAAAQLCAGALSDRCGRRGFMAGGMLLLAAGLAGFLPWPGAMPALPAATAVGLGAGTFAAASLALLHERCPDARRAEASGRYFLAWGSGYFAGPLLAGSLGLAAGAGALALAALVAAAAALCPAAWRRGC